MCSTNKLFKVVIKQNVCLRSFNTYCCLHKSYPNKDARFLGKLMTGSKKKKYYTENNVGTNIHSFINDASMKRKLPMRINVLNKLFMTYITDIMATGNLSEDLADRGIEVTKVSVSPDFNNMNVYWLAKDKEQEEYLIKVLPKVAFPLRHEISQMHVMGQVPKINFIKDTAHTRLVAISKLIESADKGESHLIKSEIDAVIEEFPPMDMNVYGLPYDKIVNKLMISLSKSRAPHRLAQTERYDQNQDSSKGDTTVSIYNEKESIRKFLLHKKLARRKTYKENKYPTEMIID